MSPYAFYIWTAYGVSLLSLTAVTLWVWRGYAKAKAQLAQLEAGK
jgi:heme exporter protein CcmD